jgi:hypothetical protein
MTGRWPTVLNVWQVPGGWSGWAEFLERTYGSVRRQMDGYFDQFDEVRGGTRPAPTALPGARICCRQRTEHCCRPSRNAA